MITQNICSAVDLDTDSSVKTASKETVERMEGRAIKAQPKFREARDRGKWWFPWG
jgi:hypothetical protein